MWLLSKVFILASIEHVLILATDFFDSNPSCFDSCSDEVNCTITHGFCGSGTSQNLSQGPDIAAEPVDLNYKIRVDGEHQYINLQWRPPEDGSYNYLTGFLVQVTVISLDPVHTGVRGTTCYNVLPASDWFKTHKLLHKKQGVFFYLNCLRFPAQASMDLVISIHSLPLNWLKPKLAMTKVNLEPDTTMWNPRFDKWADTNDVMHLVIKNPWGDAHYYGVQIKSVNRDLMVFSHIYSANPKNATNEYYMNSRAGLPHFLIPGLNKEDNYSILMDALDANKTAIPHLRSIRTNPFKLNFTAVALATSAPSQGFDNRLVIIVSVVVVVVVAILVCLVWKGIFHPRKLRKLVQVCGITKIDSSRDRTIPFVPIYCSENEHFVGAVESHVSLLRRCLESQNTQDELQPGSNFCCFGLQGHTFVDISNVSNNFIIYLSPRLSEVLKFGHSCPSECSRLDTVCHQILQSLAERQKNGQEAILITVTFDCFNKAELSCINELMSFIFPTLINTSTDHQNHLPVCISSLTTNGWKVENVDALFLKLSHHQDVAPSTPLCPQRWRECAEAEAVERHLSSLWQARSRGNNDVSVMWQNNKFTSSPKLEFHNFPTNFTRSHENIHRFNLDQYDSEHLINGIDQYRSDIKSSPNSPLLNSSGFQSLAESRKFTNSFTNDMHSNNNLKSAKIHHSPKEPHNYHRNDSNECPESVNNFPVQQIIHSDRVVMYKPNVFSKNNVHCDSFSVNSLDSDSLNKTNDLNGYIKGRDHLSNGIVDDIDCVNQKTTSRIPRSKDIIVPPCLSHSNFTSMESVCERINKVNEHSGWGLLNLSK